MPNDNASSLPTIFLFGGSSEIGQGIVNFISQPGRAYPNSKIIYVSRRQVENVSNSQTLIWKPNSVEQIQELIQNLTISQGDVAILAIGELGLYGWNPENNIPDPELIGRSIFANTVLPATLLFALSKAMTANKGGKIVLLSSVSAFPALPANNTYGLSKRIVDDLAVKLIKPLERQGVSIHVIRPGFVNTKLHSNKRKSRQSSSISEIAFLVNTRLMGSAGIAWAPRSWRLISFALSKSWLLRKLANRELLRANQLSEK